MAARYAFKCPSCGRVIRLHSGQPGRGGRCPHCKVLVAVPAAGSDGLTDGGGSEQRRVRFLKRDIGVVVGGLVAVGVVLGALIVRIWFDHQARVGQAAIQREAWANKEAGDQFRTRKEYAKALEKYMEAQKRLDALEVADLKLQRELEAALQSDEMKYLARGMVQFRGQWMTEKEREATLAQEQGLVKVDGRWVSASEKARLEETRRKAEVAASEAKRPIQLTDFSYAVVERNDLWWKFAYKLSVTNNTDRDLRIMLTIKFSDSAGFLLDDATEYRVVQARQSGDISEYTLVDANLARRVTNVAVEAQAF